jgi:hypothetical protein
VERKVDELLLLFGVDFQIRWRFVAYEGRIVNVEIFFNRRRVNSLADRVPSRRYQEKFLFFFIDGASKVIFEFCLKIDKFHFG